MIDYNLKMMPSGAPPSVLPSKSDSNVHNTIVLKENPNSPKIKICLYKYTYIWLNNGISYWVYLTSVNRCYAYGYRWLNNEWVLIKVRICNIESFICY